MKLSLPLLEWIGSYRKEWLGADVVAGLTTSAVVIPKAMAYATVAGLPIQVGLYTAFVPMIVYAVLGSSRVLSVSTSTTIAILTVAQLGRVVPNGDPAALLQATAALTLMVGAILIVAAILRLGFVANFISEPVLIGFKAGIGVVIIVDQLPKILGVHFEKGSFLHNVEAIGLNLPHTSLATLATGVLTIAGLVVIEKLRPRWPAPLMIIAAAIAAVGLFALQSYGVSLVGPIPAGVPAFTVPDLHLAQQLWPGALGIALMSFTESVAAARAFIKSDEPPLRPNTELFATGLANAVGAFMGAMPGGGGTSQTAVNRLTGAHTQLAGSVTALMSLLAMLFLSPLIALMPNAVLAAIVIVYSIGLIKSADFRHILSIRRTEFIWAVAGFLCVMLVGTLQGILVAIIVSVVALAQQTANPPVHVLGRRPGTNVFRPRSPEHSQDESFPGLLLLRTEGRLFFLNAERVAEKMRALVAETQPTVVVLDLSGVFASNTRRSGCSRRPTGAAVRVAPSFGSRDSLRTSTPCCNGHPRARDASACSSMSSSHWSTIELRQRSRAGGRRTAERSEASSFDKRASAGGAPAPRRPAAHFSSLWASRGRWGASSATACG